MNTYALRKKFALISIVACAGFLLTTGCASKKFVQDGLSTQDAKLGDMSSQIEENQRRLRETGEKLDSVEGEARDASRLGKDAGSKADQAAARADEAYNLAKGKLLYKVVLSDVAGNFSVDSSDLSDDAKGKLSENKPVFLEIQGHTDSSGDESWNLLLGERRAERVRRYLNTQHGIPLHRMSVISYGESKPVSDNGDREGRAKNRRVEVHVLS
jgi:outer membrane protein OmpA-like peptidoglycan-associated protein